MGVQMDVGETEAQVGEGMNGQMLQSTFFIEFQVFSFGRNKDLNNMTTPKVFLKVVNHFNIFSTTKCIKTYVWQYSCKAFDQIIK